MAHSAYQEPILIRLQSDGHRTDPYRVQNYIISIINKERKRRTFNIYNTRLISINPTI